MYDVFHFAILPYLTAFCWLVVPALRGLSRGAPPGDKTPGIAPSWGSRLFRISLALLAAGHAAALLAPSALALWHRSALGTAVLEAAGLALALIALAGLASALRAELADRAGRMPLVDLVLTATLGLTLASGIWLSVRYRWASIWYVEAVLPYVRSLVRFEPELATLAALPGAARVHLVSGLVTLALAPWSSFGALLARPWWQLRHRPRLRRRVLVAAAGGVLLALGTILVDALMRVGVTAGYTPQQPIAFSHALHAGTNRIPCLYCHFAAERSRHAGIPAASLCMNCHTRLRVATAELAKLKEAVAQDRPIAWVRVHNLPDFVAFNHSQHVAVAGLACQRCHGAVETMERLRQEAPLSMGWCINCHRSEGVVPPAERTAAVPEGRATGGLDCSHCHY